MKKSVNDRTEENPDFHNTYKLLRKYRDVVWSLELSIKQLKSHFSEEFGENIEEFLDSVYLAGADLSGTDIESRARSIQRSQNMLSIVDSAVDLLRAKHKHGEVFYWILFYAFLSPQELETADDVIEHLRPHVKNISPRSYYRKRQYAIDALSSVLWGYTSKQCIDVLAQFVPDEPGDRGAKM